MLARTALILAFAAPLVAACDGERAAQERRNEAYRAEVWAEKERRRQAEGTGLAVPPADPAALEYAAVCLPSRQGVVDERACDSAGKRLDADRKAKREARAASVAAEADRIYALNR